jgi:hypothetical protein
LTHEWMPFELEVIEQLVRPSEHLACLLWREEVGNGEVAVRSAAAIGVSCEGVPIV